MNKSLNIIVLFILLTLRLDGFTQFYNGVQQVFGKNRVQYQEFDWSYYKFNRFKVYSYTGGMELAQLVAKKINPIISDLENKFEFVIEDDLNFIIYNNINHFRQSNAGVNQQQIQNSQGVSIVFENNIFIYNEGLESDLEDQLREGVTRIILNKLVYGNNWKEVIKNKALLSFPDWYLEGLVDYIKDRNNLLTINKIKSLVLSGRVLKLNRLDKKESILASHLLWQYIDEKFGFNVVPNILYMARINRNIESGFLFVLGTSLKSLVKNASIYYAGKYESDEYGKNALKESNAFDIKIKSETDYYQVKISPDGNYVAYSTDKNGRKKVYTYDLQKDKIELVYKNGFQYDWIKDLSYPLLCWSPKGDRLFIIDDSKSELKLHNYSLIDKTLNSKPIYKIEKVLSASVHESGKKMLFSGVKNGLTDIYEYSIRSNVVSTIISDAYDNINPVYVNGDEIMFSSNRINDSIEFKLLSKQPFLDLFLYSPENKKISRLTKTTNTSEVGVKYLGNNNVAFLGVTDNKTTVFKANFDSTISHVDTIVHYRYYLNKNPITNYTKDIISFDLPIDQNQLVFSVFDKDKYWIYNKINPSVEDLNIKIEFPTKLADEKIQPKALIEKSYTIIEDPMLQNKGSSLDMQNFRFLTNNEVENPTSLFDFPLIKEDYNKRFIIISNNQEDNPELGIKDFELPNLRDYTLNFYHTELQTDFNFNFANENYQLHNGFANYTNPGMGMELKVELQEVFENYQIDGGFRYSLNADYKEYFFNFSDRISKVDKKYSIERQVIDKDTSGLGTTKKIVTNQFKYKLTYPFSEVLALNALVNFRADNLVDLGAEKLSLTSPTQLNVLASFKLDFTFDNSDYRALNIHTGSRAKLFLETYNNLFSLIDMQFQGTNHWSPEIYIAGLDFRKYIKVDNNIIWANRLAASTSFGRSKLLYYLGGVDNQVVLSQQFSNQFNDNLQVPDGNYLFEARATGLRGFSQNTRNGNSFVIINSELRIPLFQYLSQTPIKSDFVKNFQFVPFIDVGTAWTGRSPYSEENPFTKTYVPEDLDQQDLTPVVVVLDNQKDPVIGGFGLGLRSRLWGYFVKLDYAWPVENLQIDRRRIFLSLGYDF